MAVAFDAATEDVRTGTTSPQTFSHTGRAEGSGGVQGVVLAIVHGVSSTDHVSAASYGGVAMSRVQRNTDTANEPGAAELWFIGAGLSGKGGAQTVSYTPGATTDDIHAVVATLTANGNVELVDNDGVNNNVANPSVTLQYGGRTCIAFGALYGGGADGSAFAPNANCTTIHDHDLGAFYSEVIRQTTPGSSDFAIGGTSGTDDVAFAAAAFAEEQIDGSLSKTLGAATNAGTGDVDVAGVLAKTLGAATSTATGTVENDGELSKTLGATTGTATGAVDVAGSLSKTLGVATVVGEGTVADAGVSGVLDEALGALTAAGTGDVDIAGALSRTLGTATATGSGDVDVAGQLAQTLGAATLTGAGEADVAGVLGKTLGTASATGSGEVDLAGALAKALGALIPAANGDVDVTGAGDRTLGTATLSATGVVGDLGEVTGALSATLGAATGAGTGTTARASVIPWAFLLRKPEHRQGTARITLGAVTGRGRATNRYRVIRATLRAKLAMMGVHGTGSVRASKRQTAAANWLLGV